MCILYEMSTDLDPWRVQMEFHVIYVLLMRDEMCVFDCICVWYVAYMCNENCIVSV